MTSAAELASNKYVSFTTFTKDGRRKSTPVWIAQTDDLLGFTTGSESWKLKRLQNNSKCELQPSNAKGAPQPNTEVTSAVGRRATPEEFASIKAAITKKHPVASRLIGAASGIVGFFKKDMGPAADTAIVVEIPE